MTSGYCPWVKHYNLIHSFIFASVHYYVFKHCVLVYVNQIWEYWFDLCNYTMYMFNLLISVSISRIFSKFQLYGVVIRSFGGDIVHFVSYLEYINTLILNMTWFKGKGARNISEVPPDWPKSHFLIGNLAHCTCICTCIYTFMYMYTYI